MKLTRQAALVLFAAALTWGHQARAQNPAFTYQGRLSDEGIAASGSYNMQFSVWDAATLGGQIGETVAVTPVAVSNGLFTVTLDFGAGVFTGDSRWLEIGVRTNGAIGAYIIVSPRQPLTPTPYALMAFRSASADLVSWNNIQAVPGGFLDGVDNDTLFTAGAGLTLSRANQFSVSYAGNGTSSMASRSDHDHLEQSWSTAQLQGLSVATTVITGSGVTGLLGRQGTGAGSSLNLPAGVWGDSHDGIGVLGTTVLVNGSGVRGWHFPTHGSGEGVNGTTASDNGRGVYGLAYNRAGLNYGVFGESDSADGFGGYFINANGGADTALRALADSASDEDIHPLGILPSAAAEFAGRLGVIGASTGKSFTSYGVVGITPGSGGSGVYGYASSTNGNSYGVQGQSESTSGRGVYGHANANSGLNYGVYGLSDSADGYGVYGREGGSSGLRLTRGAGVFGESRTNHGIVGFSASYVGVYGNSETGDGVLGLSETGEGVLGSSLNGSGVESSSTASNGVFGVSGFSTGVRAHSSAGNPIEAYTGSTASPNRRFYVSNAGHVFADGAFNAGGADLAEALPVEGSVGAYESGDVLEISTSANLCVCKSGVPYSPLVAGVFATKPGVLLSERGTSEDADGLVPVGLVGILPTKVSTENGCIRKGDLLVASSTSGHAMKGTERERMLGATLGKALEDFAGPGCGRIKVLVNVK